MALLPDPAPRPRQHILISVDDHVIEPPEMFDGRLPAALAGRAPRIVETDDGRQVWRYEDRDYPNIGLNAVVGRPREDWSMEAARFDELCCGPGTIGNWRCGPAASRSGSFRCSCRGWPTRSWRPKSSAATPLAASKR